MGTRGIRYSQLSAAMVAATFAVTLAGCNDDSTNTVPLVATTVTVNSGSDAQVGTVGGALGQMISVHVSDQAGNALPGSSVTWAVLAGGGSVDAATSTTNSTGDATVNWTLGNTVGLDSLKASIASGSSVVITATANAGAAASLAMSSGDGQSVVAGSTTAPLVVKVTDQFGNAVAGATVNWTVSGGGTLSGASSTSDATGLAQITLTTDAVAATYTVTATGPAGTPVTFTVNGT